MIDQKGCILSTQVARPHSQMHHIELTRQRFRRFRQRVEQVESHILRPQLPGWELRIRDVKSVQASSGRKLSGKVKYPDTRFPACQCSCFSCMSSLFSPPSLPCTLSGPRRAMARPFWPIGEDHSRCTCSNLSNLHITSHGDFGMQLVSRMHLPKEMLRI